RCLMVSGALLRAELREMVKLDTGAWITAKYITNAAYQCFVADRLKAGEHWEPFHWKNGRLPQASADAPVVGLSPEQALAFCDWLAQYLGNTSWRYRLPNPAEAEVALRRNSASTRVEGFWQRSDRYSIEWCSKSHGSRPGLRSIWQLQTLDNRDERIV